MPTAYVGSSLDFRPRICIVGYKQLSRLVHSVIKEYEQRAEIEVIDEVFDAAMKAAKRREKEKCTDVFISAGANASILQATLSTPVTTIKVGGYDILLALLKARDQSDRIGLVTYLETVPELDAVKALLKLEIDQRAYRSADEARDCCMSLMAAGYNVIVGSSVVVELAEQHGLRGILTYSAQATRQAIETAIERAHIARLEAIKYEQLDSVLRHLQEAVVAVDEHERITAINPAMEKILGISHARAIGRKLSAISADASLRETLDLGTSEFAVVTDIGKRTYIANKVPVHSRSVMTGAVMTLQDASAIQHAETNLRSEKRQGQPSAKYHFQQIIGHGARLKIAKRTALQYARTSSTVLITGDSGTGKELFAQAIHNASDRRTGPFIALNCAAFPEQLLESELFGYEEGAFTGSKKGGKSGLFEAAHTGTVFLDEIGDMPISLQTRLLRVLQEKEVMRVGSAHPIPVDVRVIAATHHDLPERIEQHLFRRDLYYRLNILLLRLPSLRDHAEDIPELSLRLLQGYLERFGAPVDAGQILDPLNAALCAYHWPGNVRELENIVERLAVFSIEGDGLYRQNDEFLAENFPEIFYDSAKPRRLPRQYSKEKIREALEHANGNRLRAAQSLGMSRTTFWRRARSLGL
ncbi:propionate catabolism operon regulatory protein PrpR [Alcaligenaceae bacterium CGII-47]|nr:propionate catabolism operon regulatory protein PrpR [Alcaligenaceae bacterium CGII-47]